MSMSAEDIALVEKAVQGALGQIEKRAPKEYAKLKADSRKMKAVTESARAAATEHIKLSKEFVGQPEDIAERLAKHLPENRIQMIREGLDFQTFRMVITKKSHGKHWVEITREGKLLEPGDVVLAESRDIDWSKVTQYASILVEAVMFVLSAMGISLSPRQQAIVSIIAETVKYIQASSVLQTALNNFVTAWNSAGGSAYEKAKFLFYLIKDSYSVGILWTIIKGVCTNMAWYDWLLTAAKVTAMIIVALGTGGVALIAEIALIVLSAVDFARKIANLNQLETIKGTMMRFDDVISQIPISDVIKKLIKPKVDEAGKDMISSDYLKGLVLDAEYKVQLEDLYEQFKDRRNYTAKRLKYHANEMMSEHKKKKKRKQILGTVMAAAGTTFAVGAAGAGVVVVGLLFPAVVLAGAGVATAYGAGYTTRKKEAESDQHTQGTNPNPDRILNVDDTATEAFMRHLDRYREQTKKLFQTAYNMIDDVVLRVRNQGEDGVKVITIGTGNSLQHVIGSTKNVGALEDGALLGSLKTILLDVGSEGNAVDIHTIIKTAMEGSSDNAPEIIQKVVMKLDSLVIPELSDYIVNATVAAAKASGINIERIY